MNEQAERAWLLIERDHPAPGEPSMEVGSIKRWRWDEGAPNVDDTVYVARLNERPSGIVARGTVTRGPRTSIDWINRGKPTRSIEIRFNDIRGDCKSGLLPALLLRRALPELNLAAQASATPVDVSTAKMLGELWSGGRGKHSLRQYVDWVLADPQSNNADWQRRYEEITTLAQSIRADPSLLDATALHRFWKHPDNGISSLKQGVPSNAELAENDAVLREWTRNIAASPSSETYRQIFEEWDEKGRFRAVWRAATRRVFAAFAPNAYTTLVNEDDCRLLLRALGEQFQLPAPVERDWIALNTRILQCMTEAQLDPARTSENNTAIWLLFEDAKLPLPEPVPLAVAGATPSWTQTQMKQIPLNQILYGPPGTGKTHHAITKALEILEPEMAAQDVPRTDQVLAFNRLVEQGRVVFCTFHQSFSYEDFVEGLRAEAKDEKLVYVVSDGVFKTLCEKAAQGIAPEDDALASALSRFDERLDASDGERLTLKTVSTGKEFFVSRGGPGSYRVMPYDTKHPDGVYRALVKDLRKFHQHGDPRKVHNGSYVHGIVDRLRKDFGLPDYVAPKANNAEKARFVMIIDEINRGNVSRIFGELITLIEASKREGAEGLKVTLPYSKESFSVPDNVYLIGTMNTADKSLATVDIALRRRFHFTEMPPEPERLDGVMVGRIDVGQLLRKINERIEVLLDRDHCIGHASFMPLKEKRDFGVLKEVFRRQVLPLLQEYFFEDWQRIAWVLNDHRKPGDAHRFLLKPKGDMNALFGNDVELPQRNVRWTINAGAFELEASYLGVIDAALVAPAQAPPADQAA